MGTLLVWFVFLIFLGTLFTVAGSVLGVFFEVIFPLLIMYMIIKAIVKKSTGNPKKKKETKDYIDVKARERRTPDLHLSEKDRNRIDRALTVYFRKNDRLPITGDINLRPNSGRYVSLRDLAVYQKDDKVANFDEFGEDYEEFYRDVVEMLRIFSEQAEPTVHDTAQEKKQSGEEPGKKQASEYDDAEAYIDRINALNDDIADEEISNGLYQVTAYLSQIRMIEQKFPEKHKQLKKVYHYYLPILIKILEQYKNFQDSAMGTKEFKTSEDQLKKTIILINGALKKITETICAQDLTDLNANMTTLEMLLKNDGLVDDEVKLLPGGKKEGS